MAWVLAILMGSAPTATAEYVPNDGLRHTLPLNATSMLISDRAQWWYWDQGRLPAEVETKSAWASESFDPFGAGWATGSGILGYATGDGTFGTNLTRTFTSPGVTAPQLQQTVYFRRQFNLTQQELGLLQSGDRKLVARALIDDGAVLLVNGVEMARVNIPGPAEKPVVMFEFRAKAYLGRPDEKQYGFVLEAPDGVVSALHTGTNTIAAEVHDGGSDVSRADLRFDLLLVTLPVTASSVHVAPCQSTPPPQPTDAIVRGPYLIAPTVEGITVRWRTLFVGVGRVVVAPVGKGQGGRGNGVEDPPRLVWSRRCPGVDQEAVVTGLVPGTQYKYMVRSALGSYTPLVTVGTGGEDTSLHAQEWHTFRTLPDPDLPPQPFTMWAFADAGTGTGQQLRVRDGFLRYMREVGDVSPPAHNQSGPLSYIMAMGDLAYNSGTESELEANMFKPYAAALRTLPLYTVVGNHDAISSSAQKRTGPYYNAFGMPSGGQSGGVPSGSAAFYSFDIGDVHFVVLDGGLVSEYNAMVAWLQEDLGMLREAGAVDGSPEGTAVPRPRKRPYAWLVGIVHEPPYSKGSEDSDTHKDQTRVREELLPMLEEAGLDLLLSGHSHSYERSVLVKGHHGTTGHWDPHRMIEDSGLGCEFVPYQKPTGLTPYSGFVSVVAGSGGKTQVGAGFTHPVHRRFNSSDGARGLMVAGSLAVQFDGPGNALRVVFVDENGQPRDAFHIVKPGSNWYNLKDPSSLEVPCLDVHSGPFSEELEREQRQAAATAATEAAVFASLVVGIVLVGAASQSGACRRLVGTLVHHVHGVLQHVAVRVVSGGRLRGSGGGVRYANVNGREPGLEDL